MWPDEWVNPDHRASIHLVIDIVFSWRGGADAFFHRAQEYPVTRLRLLIAFRAVRSGVAGVTSGVKQAAKALWEYGRRFGCRVVHSGAPKNQVDSMSRAFDTLRNVI
jgi:hypothetical protein